MLDQPKLFSELQLSKIPPNYRWDDDTAEAMYSKSVPVIEKALVPISGRGRLAFSAACAEWVAWRLETSPNHPILLQCVEATWAAVGDWRLFDRKCKIKKLFPGGDVSGLVNGALYHSASVLKETVDLMAEEESALSFVASIHILAEHVLPDKQPFRDWRGPVIEYLKKNTPADKKDLLGIPVPRDYFWALRPLDAAATKSMAAFAAQARASKNTFLLHGR